VPSRENTTAVTQSVCPVRAITALPAAASHSRAVLSWEPVKTRVPSGENTTDQTEFVCPARVATASPVAAFPQPRRVVLGAGQDASAVS